MSARNAPSMGPPCGSARLLQSSFHGPKLPKISLNRSSFPFSFSSLLIIVAAGSVRIVGSLIVSPFHWGNSSAILDQACFMTTGLRLAGDGGRWAGCEMCHCPMTHQPQTIWPARWASLKPDLSLNRAAGRGIIICQVSLLGGHLSLISTYPLHSSNKISPPPCSAPHRDPNEYLFILGDINHTVA